MAAARSTGNERRSQSCPRLRSDPPPGWLRPGVREMSDAANPAPDCEAIPPSQDGCGQVYGGKARRSQSWIKYKTCGLAKKIRYLCDINFFLPQIPHICMNLGNLCFR